VERYLVRVYANALVELTRSWATQGVHAPSTCQLTVDTRHGSAKSTAEIPNVVVIVLHDRDKCLHNAPLLGAKCKNSAIYSVASYRRRGSYVFIYVCVCQSVNSNTQETLIKYL